MNRITKKLNLKEALALNRILQERYASSGLSNPEFAVSINSNAEEAKLFRFLLNRDHIQTAIEAAEIPSNVRRGKPHSPEGECFGLVARVQALEEQLARLTKHLRDKGV